MIVDIDKIIIYFLKLVKKHRSISIILSIVVVIVLVSLFRSLGGNEDLDRKNTIKYVEIANVGALSRDISPLPVLGRVVSIREARVTTGAQGEIVGVYQSSGDYVSAGTIIAEIENSSERATVLQAKSSLEKLKKGGRDEEVDILNITASQAEQILDEAKISSIDTLRGVFATADDVVRNKIDELFNNPQSRTPTIIFSTNNSQLKIDIENTRVSIEEMLVEWNSSIALLNTEDDLLNSLNEAQLNIFSVRSFTDDMARAVNILTPNVSLSQATIAVWKSNIALARSSLSLGATSLSQSKDNLSSKETSFDIANKQFDIGSSGARNEDIEVGEATLSIALSRLEKTLIRSPIGGTINFLEIKRGDFVGIFQPVLVISSNDALEIKAFITSEDKENIVVGSAVLIKNTVDGTVTKVAEALDKNTKKIEVTISINKNEYDGLTNGESVQLLINRKIKKDTGSLKEIFIPISSLKITPDGMNIFVVGENNELISVPVITGPIVGEKIIVDDGIDETFEIVIDARGLKSGQIVEIRLN